jgi:hypothetical protein
VQSHRGLVSQIPPIRLSVQALAGKRTNASFSPLPSSPSFRSPVRSQNNGHGDHTRLCTPLFLLSAYILTQIRTFSASKVDAKALEIPHLGSSSQSPLGHTLVKTVQSLRRTNGAPCEAWDARREHSRHWWEVSPPSCVAKYDLFHTTPFIILTAIPVLASTMSVVPLKRSSSFVFRRTRTRTLPRPLLEPSGPRLILTMSHLPGSVSGALSAAPTTTRRQETKRKPMSPMSLGAKISLIQRLNKTQKPTPHSSTQNSTWG